MGRVLNAMLRPFGLRLVRRAAHSEVNKILGDVVQCHLADDELIEHLRQFHPKPSAKQAAEVERIVFSPSWNRTYQRSVEPLRDFLEATSLPETWWFLDVGSAVGQLLPQLRDMRFTGRYVGVDIGGQFLSCARRRSMDMPWPAPFIQADAAYLPFAAGAFNVVFSRSTLVAQQDWRKALREMLRVSSKYVILLDTPFHQGNEQTTYFMQLSKNHAAMLCTLSRQALYEQLPPNAKVHLVPGEESDIVNGGSFRWHNVCIELT